MLLTPVQVKGLKVFALKHAAGAMLSTCLYSAIDGDRKVTDVKKTKQEYGLVAGIGAFLGWERAIPVSVALAVEKRLDILG